MWQAPHLYLSIDRRYELKLLFSIGKVGVDIFTDYNRQVYIKHKNTENTENTETLREHLHRSRERGSLSRPA